MKKFNYNYNKIAWVCITFLIMITGCKKDFLETKPNVSLSTVTSLMDCQLLLNNEDIFNRNSDPGMGALSAEPFSVLTTSWQSSFSTTEKNTFIYAKSIYAAGDPVNDWNNPYKQVFYANTVLDALQVIKVSAGEQATYNSLKGTALFCRSWAFYNLVQTFALPYEKGKVNNQPGILLRLSSDLNIKYNRASVEDCYKQILNDVKESLQLLPANVSVPTKPTITAANAFLARIYLVMGDYQSAYDYADAVIKSKPNLIDFNTLDLSQLRNLTTTTATPYPISEDIYHATLGGAGLMSFNRMIVDDNLYRSYDANDLRQKAFFSLYNGYIRFKGSYDFKTAIAFTGLATDEIYLIRAESSARLGNFNSTIKDLNTLREKRFVMGKFVPLQATNSEEALKLVLLERSKELCFRGLRWSDVRRLNQEPAFATTLSHIIDGVNYQLPPNDKRFALPIPEVEIELSGIPQNER